MSDHNLSGRRSVPGKVRTFYVNCSCGWTTGQMRRAGEADRKAINHLRDTLRPTEGPLAWQQ